MFLESSRYYRQKTLDVKTKGGRTVKALTLRRLPIVIANPAVVKGNDRLDIMAQRQYNDPTMFWHIADANTELQANDLVEKPGHLVKVPEQ
jgi:hypothetical protein